MRISTFQDIREVAEAKLSLLPSLHILIRPSIEQPLFASLLATNGSAGKEEQVSRNRLDWTRELSVVDGASCWVPLRHHMARFPRAFAGFELNCESCSIGNT